MGHGLCPAVVLLSAGCDIQFFAKISDGISASAQRHIPGRQTGQRHCGGDPDHFAVDWSVSGHSDQRFRRYGRRADVGL
ncbi:hypothetical protein D3C80_1248320 [compost metagenome]